eukprot:2596874-Rhodomonas_salina.1
MVEGVMALALACTGERFRRSSCPPTPLPTPHPSAPRALRRRAAHGSEERSRAQGEGGREREERAEHGW